MVPLQCCMDGVVKEFLSKRIAATVQFWWEDFKWFISTYALSRADSFFFLLSSKRNGRNYEIGDIVGVWVANESISKSRDLEMTEKWRDSIFDSAFRKICLLMTFSHLYKRVCPWKENPQCKNFSTQFWFWFWIWGFSLISYHLFFLVSKEDASLGHLLALFIFSPHFFVLSSFFNRVNYTSMGVIRYFSSPVEIDLGNNWRVITVNDGTNMFISNFHLHLRSTLRKCNN